MNQCNQCRSYAINLNQNGRDDTDPDLCDACYWRRRATQAEEVVNRLPKTSDGVPIYPGMTVWALIAGREISDAEVQAVGIGGVWRYCYSTREAAEKARNP